MTNSKKLNEAPEQAQHSDSSKSALPERNDEGRKQAPNDTPPETSIEKEPSVG